MDGRWGEFQAWVEARVASGDYGSASEGVQAGLRLLKEREEHSTRLRRWIAEGAADIRAGRIVDGEAVFARLRAEASADPRQR